MLKIFQSYKLHLVNVVESFVYPRHNFQFYNRHRETHFQHPYPQMQEDWNMALNQAECVEYKFLL